MPGSPALAFGALVAGAVIIDYGVKNAKGAFNSSSQSPTRGTSSNTAAPVDPSSLTGSWKSAVAPGVTTAGLQPQVIAAIIYAKAHGWPGQVISGFRSFAEQSKLYQELHGKSPVAFPGTSDHEKGIAIDVTDPTGFAAALQGAPAGARLIQGTSFGDPGHFSTDGH